MLALFNLGGGETILILALLLILSGARNLPGLTAGLRQGFFEFRKAIRQIRDEIDGEARDAGRSVVGIHGKRAAEALTVGNHVAEMYDPAVFREQGRPGKLTSNIKRLLMRAWRSIWRFMRGLLKIA